MPHVTFIHGIGNKPEENQLLDIWRRSLADNLGIDLADQGITSTMVYWADVLYPAPDPNVAAYESAVELEATAAAVDATTNPGPPRAPTIEEAAFMAKLAAKVGGTLAAVHTVENIPPDRTRADRTQAATIERVPLPWPLKEAFLENFLRDVHHYLFNTECSPRPGTTYRVQDEIRSRFVAKLGAIPAGVRPHVVVSHSMGTVIAYDCLKRVPECAKVDGLMTIGSPLGLDEIQDKLQPGWTRAGGFPREKVGGDWVNVFDRLDPVAGFDPFLANDFQEGGHDKIDDINEQNYGAWRHSIGKYLRGPQLRKALNEMFEA
jgi:pimeloyl-ACP methyl ester carboxylesterase